MEIPNSLFNTGLYTRRYETIYGLFEPNTKPDARQRWFLKGFFKEIDHILGDEENLTRSPASLMGEGNSLLLRRAFEGAVVEAARRAAANYTLAVAYNNARLICRPETSWIKR